MGWNIVAASLESMPVGCRTNLLLLIAEIKTFWCVQRITSHRLLFMLHNVVQRTQPQCLQGCVLVSAIVTKLPDCGLGQATHVTGSLRPQCPGKAPERNLPLSLHRIVVKVTRESHEDPALCQANRRGALRIIRCVTVQDVECLHTICI